MSEDRGGLVVRDLTVERSGSAVVRNVSLQVPRGSVVALLGANGAGKTSLLEALSASIPSRGEVVLDGIDLRRMPASRRARLGLAHVEQGRTVVGDLSVEQNLLVAAPRRALAKAWEVFPELEPLRRRRGDLLSGGQQQMLVIARALLTEPRYLLLDELSLGLAPTVVRRLLPVVAAEAARGVGVLLVEQFAHAALRIADNAYVLAHGQVAYAGDPGLLAADPDLLRGAYLGAAPHDESSDTRKA